LCRRRPSTIFGFVLLASAGVPHIEAGAGAPSLRLLVPDGHRPGIPVLVRLDLFGADGSPFRGLWDAEAVLSSPTPGATLAPSRIVLHNGVGSALVTVTAVGSLELHATAVGLEAVRTLRSLADEPVQSVSGALPAGLTEWSGVVRVTADLRVPDGATLRVLPGTLVLIAGVVSGDTGADIDVEGAIEVLGTEEQPVTFTAADPTRPWGEIHHASAEPSLYLYAIITRAGHSPRGGHTNTGPAVRPQDSSLTFESSSLTDNAGKVMQASGSDLVFRDTLLSRSVMGPEIDGTGLLFEDSAILEMPAPGYVCTPGAGDTDCDNDGIYIHDQQAGQEVRLSGSVIAAGDDDGIDTLGADDVVVEDCVLRDWVDKAVSVFHDEVTLRRCVVTTSRFGVSAKTDNDRVCRVEVDHCTFADNCVAIEAKNKSNQPRAVINFVVTNSILRGIPASRRGEVCESDDEIRAIRTDYDPAQITVRYSDLSDLLAGAENTATITADPLFVSPPEHDFRLQEASPCIDAGDPASPPDPDGSRTDMGAFPFLESAPPPAEFRRGEANGDGAYDLSDPVTVLLHLFAAGALDCADAADANDDGRLDLSDPVYMLRHQFNGGPRPPEPFLGCGPDPMADLAGELGCEVSPCS
jgi:hypothetical protein